MGSANEIKLFDKYPFDEVTVSDMALTDYIAVKTSDACYIPHSAGRWQKVKFKKVVELHFEIFSVKVQLYDGAFYGFRPLCTRSHVSSRSLRKTSSVPSLSLRSIATSFCIFAHMSSNTRISEFSLSSRIFCSCCKMSC